jgi:biopolymer transport protein ExbB
MPPAPASGARGVRAGGLSTGRLPETHPLLSLIAAAGWPVWFLIAASVAAVALIIERGLALRTSRVLPPRVFDEVLALQRSRPLTPDLLSRLESGPPLARILAPALRHEGAPRGVLREAMEDAGRAVAHELERNLAALATLATLAPLLGLFGTVVGMIEIFGAQAPGSGNPQQLAHGVSVALYNTAFGLIVAIPTMLAHRYYRSRVDALLARMEQQALRFIDGGRAPRGPRP